MPDLLERGMVWLTQQLQDHASQPVVYVRGEQFVEVRATLGRTVFAFDQEIAGVPVAYSEGDFLIRSSDLVLSGQRVEPADHDEIWWTSEGVTLVYQALAPGNEPSWRYADPFRRMVRIHTKFIRTELFAMPGTLQNITLYRGSETRTIQVNPDLFQATEIDFRQYAGGGFRVPAGSPLNGYQLTIFAAIAPGAAYSPIMVNGSPLVMNVYEDQFNELPDPVYGAGALRFVASMAGPLELVLKT